MRHRFDDDAVNVGLYGVVITNPAGIMQEAMSVWSAGQVRQAIGLMEALLAEYPGWEHGVTAYYVSCLYDEIGDDAQARHWNLKALESGPGDTIFVMGYLSLLYGQGLFDEALAFAEDFCARSNSETLKKEVIGFSEFVKANRKLG